MLHRRRMTCRRPLSAISKGIRSSSSLPSSNSSIVYAPAPFCLNAYSASMYRQQRVPVPERQLVLPGFRAESTGALPVGMLSLIPPNFWFACKMRSLTHCCRASSNGFPNAVAQDGQPLRVPRPVTLGHLARAALSGCEPQLANDFVSGAHFKQVRECRRYE